jgi:plastocyanin
MGKQIFDRIEKNVAILLVVFFLVTLTTVSATLAAPAGTPQPVGGASKVINVSIQNSAYNPATVQISTGDTVKWTNMDSSVHTVNGSIFKSGNLNKGQSYEFQFTKPGTYTYTSLNNPTMKGTIIVVAKM